ncbi:FixH family protein [Bacillus benzoevorans]|uniref:YtkA-like domain-containing protein n=1 Tax=Bacillus benzoevorans TaxID=1456 RepID=A0A7X0HVR6_9BACI|nr:FixH family protein [Bacillus benzoevorans]MBB6446525.1 hypothetical protein [Bacillus benzoevorans]
MKKRLYLLVLLFLLISVVTACSGQKEKDRVPLFLNVDLTVNPVQGSVNEPVTFTAKVTYGEEAVTDPDEVVFEIWRANDEKHEKIPVKHAGDGIYELKKGFTEEGTYYIYSHVTAEGYHAMPKKEFVIGQPSEPEAEGGAAKMTDTEMNDDTKQQ